MSGRDDIPKLLVREVSALCGREIFAREPRWDTGVVTLEIKAAPERQELVWPKEMDSPTFSFGFPVDYKVETRTVPAEVPLAYDVSGLHMREMAHRIARECPAHPESMEAATIVMRRSKASGRDFVHELNDYTAERDRAVRAVMRDRAEPIAYAFLRELRRRRSRAESPASEVHPTGKLNPK